ncbi:MAG: hypothetical protein OXP36_07060 [Gammaproteobacteria bacterium]|nr:hypothetical protein [Gammaproteobacteria bacterium]
MRQVSVQKAPTGNRIKDPRSWFDDLDSDTNSSSSMAPKTLDRAFETAVDTAYLHYRVFRPMPEWG